MATKAERRYNLIERAAVACKPVQITYQCEKDSPEVEVRIIEIHHIWKTTKGDIVLRAYCRERQDFRTFRVDRILAHRTMRLVWRGPTPAFDAYLSGLAFGAPVEMEPVPGIRDTAYSILATVYEGIAKAPALTVLRDAKTSGEPVALTYDNGSTDGPVAGRVVQIVDVRKPTWNSGWFVTAHCTVTDETFVVRHKEISAIA